MNVFNCVECGHEIQPRLLCKCEWPKIDAAQHEHACWTWQDGVATDICGAIAACETFEQLEDIGDELKFDASWLRNHERVRSAYKAGVERLRK